MHDELILSLSHREYILIIYQTLTNTYHEQSNNVALFTNVKVLVGAQ